MMRANPDDQLNEKKGGIPLPIGVTTRKRFDEKTRKEEEKGKPRNRQDDKTASTRNRCPWRRRFQFVQFQRA